jgi:anthranilate phosphoribosyltransferase
MRHVAPVRRALGVRTLMNCMGPLLNPLGVRRQLIGVYARSLVEPLAGALGDLGALRALVVHGSDGLDEITTTGITYAAWLDEGRITRMEIDPRALGIAVPAAGALAGGDAHRNAEILRAVLAGERGACRDVALLNAAAALWVGGVALDLADGLGVAARSLDRGAAQAKLDALVEASHRAVRAA